MTISNSFLADARDHAAKGVALMAQSEMTMAEAHSAILRALITAVDHLFVADGVDAFDLIAWTVPVEDRKVRRAMDGVVCDQLFLMNPKDRAAKRVLRSAMEGATALASIHKLELTHELAFTKGGNLQVPAAWMMPDTKPDARLSESARVAAEKAHTETVIIDGRADDPNSFASFVAAAKVMPLRVHRIICAALMTDPAKANSADVTPIVTPAATTLAGIPAKPATGASSAPTTAMSAAMAKAQGEREARAGEVSADDAARVQAARVLLGPGKASKDWAAYLADMKPAELVQMIAAWADKDAAK